ncbi:MAG: flagellar FliJ family protein [Fimbriimonadaceae bacterium]
MPKFAFRLHRVLDYRTMLEDWAKRAYLEAQRSRLEGDSVLARIHERRARALDHPALSLEDRLALERTLFAIDDLEHQQRLALQVLMEEEGQALAAWIERKRDAEALRKLRDKAYAEWEYDQDRREQADLDEWSVLRRAA